MTRLRDALSIFPGEAARVGWLSLHSLANGFFFAFFFSAANALFLDSFEAADLPLAYLASGLAGFAAVRLLAALERRLSFFGLLLVNLLFLLALTLAFWSLLYTGGGLPVVFLLFVAIGPCFTLLGLEYWTLVGRLLDLRQGKRLFGLLGSGEVVSTSLAFFLVPLFVRVLPRPGDLLLLAVGGLVACLGVAGVLRRRFPRELGESRETAGAGLARERERERAGVALGELVRSHYFLLAFVLMLFLTVAHYVVDFGFLAQVREQFAGSADLAAFIGVFFGVVKGIELLAQTVLSGRLISSLGLRFGLLVLPVCLLGVVALAALFGAVGVAAAHLFVLLAFAKLLWLVLRTSIFEPSTRVLFQPLPAAQRVAFQTHVEGTATQVGVGVVGLVLLAVGAGSAGGRSSGLSALPLFYGLVPVLLAWIFLGDRLHRAYRARLLVAIAAERPAGGSVAGGSRSTAAGEPRDELLEHLLACSPDDLVVALSILQRVDPATPVPLLLELIARGDAGQRQLAVEHLGRHRALEVRRSVEALSAGSEPPALRRAAAGAVQLLFGVEALTSEPARLAAFARSGDPALREQAAAAAGRAGRQGYETLSDLLWDRGWNVRRLALVAAGRAATPLFHPRILAHLGSTAFANAAVAAAVLAGKPILPSLEIAFGKAALGTEVRLRILRIYEQMKGQRSGGPEVTARLVDKLRAPQSAVLRRVLALLAAAGYRAAPREEAALKRRIEELAERSAWNLAALLDLAGEPAAAPVCECLAGEIGDHRETLYALLALLYDPRAVALVHDCLAGAPEGGEASGGTSAAGVYALEVIELVVADDLRRPVLALMEELSPAQRLKRLEPIALQPRLAAADRLAAILHRDPDRIGSWTKAFALLALGEVSAATAAPVAVTAVGDPGGRTAAPADVVAYLSHPDPLLQELATVILHRLDPALYERHAGRLPAAERGRLDRLVAPLAANAATPSTADAATPSTADAAAPPIADPAPAPVTVESEAAAEARTSFGRARILRRLPAFAALPWEILVQLGPAAGDRHLTAGDRIPSAKDPPATLHVVLAGRLADPQGVEAAPGTVVVATRLAVHEARGTVVLLRFDGDRLLQLAGDHPALLLAVLRAVRRDGGGPDLASH